MSCAISGDSQAGDPRAACRVWRTREIASSSRPFGSRERQLLQSPSSAAVSLLRLVGGSEYKRGRGTADCGTLL
jgi:hypothetical protein